MVGRIIAAPAGLGKNTLATNLQLSYNVSLFTQKSAASVFFPPLKQLLAASNHPALDLE